MTRPAGAGAVTPLRTALTPRGLAVLAGSVLVLAAGLLLRYPELIGLGGAGTTAVAAALLVVARTPRAHVEREVRPARVARGAHASARVRVRNAGRRSSAAVVARDVAGPGTVPFRIPRLRAGGFHEGLTPLPTSRRGVVVSGPLLVDRADPLGLAHRTLNTGGAAELYVRPRAVDLPEVGASLARSVDGPQADTMMEGTLAFHALREYIPGDERRHIHWRATARAGKLIVKQHVDTAHAALAVVLDVAVAPGDAGAEAFEVAVDCAASVAAAAASRRYPLLLLASGGESLLPGAIRQYGSYRVDDVLDSLTRAAAAEVPAGALPATVRRLAASERGSLAMVVSTRPLDWLAAPLQSLAGSYARVLAVQVLPAGQPAVTVARTGRVLWAGVRQADDLAGMFIRARAAA